MENASCRRRGKSGSNWNIEYKMKMLKDSLRLLIDRMYIHWIYNKICTSVLAFGQKVRGETERNSNVGLRCSKGERKLLLL